MDGNKDGNVVGILKGGLIGDTVNVRTDTCIAVGNTVGLRGILDGSLVGVNDIVGARVDHSVGIVVGGIDIIGINVGDEISWQTGLFDTIFELYPKEKQHCLL